MSEAPPASGRSRLLLATANEGKIAELAALLSGAPLRLLTLSDIKSLTGRAISEPEEGAADFLGNAAIKAEHYSRLSGLPALADDSGLEAAALGGRPGVMSASYGGADLSDNARCKALLTEMEGLADRRAQFRAALALSASGRILSWEGSLSGRIGLSLRGAGGFGYDPIFIPEGSDLTLAEMGPDAKNAISHRGRALASFLADLDRAMELIGGGGRVCWPKEPDRP